jgi:hypothetical protein
MISVNGDSSPIRQRVKPGKAYELTTLEVEDINLNPQTPNFPL